ncbi:MAG: Gfo/Idh/MocA family oxidoreductase, partial [Bacteroidota bacterium]
MVKVGVLGAGHLGKIHLQCLSQLPAQFKVRGFFDIDPEAARHASEKFNLPVFPNFEALLDAVDAVDIVTPTTTHFDLARQAMLRGKHVFIEKPLTETPEEAQELVELARSQGIVAQVGHVERFNPAMLAVSHLSLAPMFVEAHRLASFNPRGTDVPVVLDLMIHDIDIVLSLVKSAVKTISASGVAVVSDTPDIANARIEFENGCVANLTASRISLKQMRKVRLFQRDAYISLDFLEKEAQIIRLFEKGKEPPDVISIELETPAGVKMITMETPPAESVMSKLALSLTAA